MYLVFECLFLHVERQSLYYLKEALFNEKITLLLEIKKTVSLSNCGFSKTALIKSPLIVVTFN